MSERPGGSPEGRRVGFESAGPPAMRLRVKFSKAATARFLGHLDLLKCLERALRRAGLPMAYSEGFHPHLRIHFGPPLPLGYSSQGEWMDLDLAEPLSPADFMQRLNAALPDGVKVLEVREIPMGIPSLQAVLERAVYMVEVEGPEAELRRVPERIVELLSQQEIPLEKKNKTVNLRRFVEDLRAIEPVVAPVTMRITLRLGTQGSIRPEEVLEALAPEGGYRAGRVERVALQELRKGTWVEPWP